MIEEYFAISARNIKRRKLRSWLTVFGIVISIATIFMLVSISLGLSAAVEEQFRQLGTDKFFISPKGVVAPGSTGSVTLGDDDINALNRISGVHDTFGYSMSPIKVEFSDEVRFTNALGMPLDDSFTIYEESGFMEAETGRILAQGDSRKVAVGSQFTHNNFFSEPVQVGDTIKINDVNFRVKAVLKTVGSPPDDKLVYMSLGDFEELFPDKEGVYDQLIVQADNGANVSQVAERARKQLVRTRGVTDDTQDFTILTPEELLATFGVVLNILTGFLLGVAAISLLVGAIGIANTMYTSVLERTKEIGVMKAVGARNSDITQLFTIESGLIGLIGGIGGVILGFGIAKVIEFIGVNVIGTSLMQVSTPWYLFVGSLLFSFIIGAVSGLVPALHASKIRPVEALRYE